MHLLNMKNLITKVAPFLITVLLSGFCESSWAQTTDYFTLINNSNWYVPVPNMLAYGSSSSSFSNPFPIGDQTLWNGLLATSLSGSATTTFTGTSNATLKIAGIPSPSQSTMSGKVSPTGAIAIVFTPTGGGATTLGLGQFENIGGINEMEMQMITGTSLLVTHWAYMLPYNPSIFTPPQATTIPVSNANPVYSWTPGTVWKMVSSSLFGSASPGRFVINGYNGSYFTGIGVGPSGSAITFTELGSITPQGKVLFATINNGSATVNASYGVITGTNSTATMTLAGYDATTATPTGYYTYLTQIAPYTGVVSTANNPAATGAANSLWNMATTTLGLTGVMAPVLTALDNLNGTAQSNAISQTIPLLAGAGSQATASSQRSFSQFVSARQNHLLGNGNGDEILGNRDVWGKAYGAWGNQKTFGNVAGYSSNTGGLILGTDYVASPRTNLGLAFGVSTNSISANNSGAPSNLNINSYQIGAYGDYAISKDLNWSYQANGALNQNTGSRNISFYGVTANSSYSSYTGHIGTGLQQYFDADDQNRFTPFLRADYLTVQSNAYSESNAGALNLNVNNQTWNELYTTAGLKWDYEFLPKIKLSTNIAAGYNVLNRQVLLTSSYAGGGDAFTTYGLQLSPWLYSGGIGVGGMLQKDLELNIRYDVQTSTSGYLVQIASAKLKFYL